MSASPSGEAWYSFCTLRSLIMHQTPCPGKSPITKKYLRWNAQLMCLLRERHGFPSAPVLLLTHVQAAMGVASSSHLYKIWIRRGFKVKASPQRGIYIYLRHSLHVTLCTSLSSYARAHAHAHAISAPHPLHVALCTWLPARHSLHVAPRASLSARHSLYVTHRTSLSARHSLHVVLCGFGGVLTHVTRVPFFGDVQSEWVSNGASHVNTVPLS